MQVASRINDILKSRENPEEKIFFAVGNAHFLVGNSSLLLLLQEYGYTLEHLSSWEKHSADDMSDAECGVAYDSKLGYYVEVPPGGGNSTIPDVDSDRDKGSQNNDQSSDSFSKSWTGMALSVAYSYILYINL